MKKCEKYQSLLVIVAIVAVLSFLTVQMSEEPVRIEIGLLPVAIVLLCGVVSIENNSLESSGKDSGKEPEQNGRRMTILAILAIVGVLLLFLLREKKTKRR